MDISTGLGLLAGAIVVLTMIFMGGDLRMFIRYRAFLQSTTACDQTRLRAINGDFFYARLA